ANGITTTVTPITGPGSSSGQRLSARGETRSGSAFVPPVVEAGPRHQLVVGEVSTIGLQGVARIAIGNGMLVKATVVDDRQIVLLAEAPGQTTMHVWLKSGRQLSYELNVQSTRPDKVLQDLQNLMKEVPGISARMVGDRIVMEGRYPDAETAERLKKLTDNFPQVLNLVPGKPADADPLQMERMVQIDLRVIEVKKRALDQLGIKWSGSAAGPTFATNILGYANTPWRPSTTAGYPTVGTTTPALTYLGLATQITSALNFLEQNGDAWTLAEPRLSCRSGGEATFLAGGEIPIPISQGFGAVSVEYKEYGVRIEFKPVADGNGNIDSKLMVEVSEPDSRNSNGGFVAFTTNRTDTQVALKQGEPLVIAGLMRQRTERSAEQIPGLGRLPLISYLFGAKEHTSEMTELFVIATPRIITPDAALAKLQLEKAEDMARQAKERSGGRLEPNAAQGPYQMEP
ncbi:type II and III secretion system protein family protein, partial [Ideonella sp.]|uniref:type II and III secretion system protein family protein n=1 Tax=Ideonella sp. TaxID=1929293 RepID=UPI003BB6CACB